MIFKMKYIKTGFLGIFLLFLLGLGCTSSIQKCYKNYELQVYSLSLVNTKVVESSKLNKDERFYKSKLSPKQCFSYFKYDSGILCNICKDSFYEYRIFDYDKTQHIDNFTWINDSLVLFVFDIIQKNFFHDSAIFVFNINSGNKHIQYSFKGTDFSHSSLVNNTEIFTSPFDFSNDYYSVSSVFFESVFLTDDSSILLPIKISYKDTVTHDSVLIKRNNMPILARVYNDNSTKRNEFMPFKFKDLFPSNHHTSYLHPLLNGIHGKQISDNSILIGSAISDRMIVYNFKDDSYKIIAENPIFEQGTGYKSAYKAIRGDYFDSNHHDIFGNIYFNPKNNLYFRYVELGISPIHLCPSINTKSIFQVFDSLFNMIGIIQRPLKLSFHGFDMDGNFIFVDIFKSRMEGKLIYHTYKMNDEPKLIKERVLCPQIKKDMEIPIVTDADIKEYVKKIIPSFKKYEEFLIVPLFEICPTCRESLICYLENVRETSPNIAIIIINDHNKLPFNHLKHVYYDSDNTYSKYFKNNGYIPLFKRKENTLEYVKSFEPVRPDKLSEFLNPNYSIFNMDCFK